MSKSKVEHTTIRNEKLFCLNCGGQHPLVMPIPIKEMTNKIVEAWEEALGLLQQ